MKQALRNISLSFTLGYIVMFLSEFLFWAKPENNTDSAAVLITWLVYSALAFIFLILIKTFNVNNFYSLFIAAAALGWLGEGLVVQTMYDTFPLNISWTGLAWHALISVIIGWYYLRKVLAENKYLKTILISSIIGFSYGFWAIFWWIDKGIVITLKSFSIYSILITIPFILSHYLYNKLNPTKFNPSKTSIWIITIIFILYYIFITIPANIMSLILLPLLYLLYFTLKKNKSKENIFNQVNIKPLNYLLLFFIPIVAILFYAFALAINLKFLSNLVIYFITMPLGFILLIRSIKKTL